MIFLAESGSTKTDAVILDKDGQELSRFSTMGFNPYFHRPELIKSELMKVDELREHREEIAQVYFYGAGCSSPQLCEVVRQGIQPLLPDAQVEVDHDLKACAYSTYTGEPAVSCILGTGSNSVYFDGKDIQPSNSGLGFILGDEGSASYLGKKLITAYFYKRMPAEFRQQFAHQYNMDKDHVVKRVYQEERANVYLAGMAPFVSEHIDEPFFWEMVFSGFREFVDYHVLSFEKAREVPIHFVGSIAYHFKDVLRDVLDHFDLQMGEVIQKPLDGLIQYHRENHLQNSPH